MQSSPYNCTMRFSLTLSISSLVSFRVGVKNEYVIKQNASETLMLLKAVECIYFMLGRENIALRFIGYVQSTLCFERKNHVIVPNSQRNIKFEHITGLLSILMHRKRQFLHKNNSRTGNDPVSQNTPFLRPRASHRRKTVAHRAANPCHTDSADRWHFARRNCYDFVTCLPPARPCRNARRLRHLSERATRRNFKFNKRGRI